jgi:hypothetical protein
MGKSGGGGERVASVWILQSHILILGETDLERHSEWRGRRNWCERGGFYRAILF